MTDQDKINVLQQKLDSLIKRQDVFQKEIADLKYELRNLQVKTVDEKTSEMVDAAKAYTQPETDSFNEPIVFSTPLPPPVAKREPKIHAPSDWEKFIGENLINKIGVLILILGVGIGAKYAIDNELISPLTRIILGYLVGLGLFGFALKLKPKFENFSAVLLSGSMAILYFITFLAYSLYGLIPQTLTFVIMVTFTAFTVFAALKYNQQVIAMIGLVGAYAVPFLLSDGSGKVLVLFSYMALINIGILIIAFKKYWGSLNLIAFCATWLIFISWAFSGYDASLHFNLALVFLFLFFAIFYTAFLSYKLIKKENYEAKDVFAVLSNAFIFYGLGLCFLDEHPLLSNYFGLFTLLNAVIHFGVSTLIYQKKLADKSLFYLIIGLVLTFITLAIPIQLDGKWVTIAWAFQGGLLFWLGRTKKVSLYEILSYAVMLLAFFSLLEDWFRYDNAMPVFNADFLNSILFAAVFGGIFYIQRNFIIAENQWGNQLASLMNYFVPAVFLLVFYNAFRMEISNFWDLKYEVTKIPNTAVSSYEAYYYNANLLDYKTVWTLNYSLLFLSGLLYLMQTKIRDFGMKLSVLLLSIAATVAFITVGLLSQNDLIYTYVNPGHQPLFNTGFFAVIVHYIALLFLGFFVYRFFIFYIRASKTNQTIFEIVFSSLLVWILSCEMLIWINAHNAYDNNKLGLSILWGICSLLLISYGIWKNRKQLRVAAIILFGITLVKLFLYDIAHLGTISKTIVFVSLGILLLVISFLYNKYKNLILDDNKT